MRVKPEHIDFNEDHFKIVDGDLSIDFEGVRGRLGAGVNWVDEISDLSDKVSLVYVKETGLFYRWVIGGSGGDGRYVIDGDGGQWISLGGQRVFTDELPVGGYLFIDKFGSYSIESFGDGAYGLDINDGLGVGLRSHVKRAIIGDAGGLDVSVVDAVDPGGFFSGFIIEGDLDLGFTPLGLFKGNSGYSTIDVAGDRLVSFDEDLGYIGDFALSGFGSYAGVCSDGEHIYIGDSSTNELHRIKSGILDGVSHVLNDGLLGDLDLGPMTFAGGYLYVISFGRTYRVDVSDWGNVRVIDYKLLNGISLGGSPDGRHILCGDSSGNIRRLKTYLHEVSLESKNFAVNALGLAYSDDGRNLFIAGADQKLYRVDVSEARATSVDVVVERLR